MQISLRVMPCPKMTTEPPSFSFWHVTKARGDGVSAFIAFVWLIVLLIDLRRYDTQQRRIRARTPCNSNQAIDEWISVHNGN